jgi:hypothetical protein
MANDCIACGNQFKNVICSGEVKGMQLIFVMNKQNIAIIAGLLNVLRLKKLNER